MCVEGREWGDALFSCARFTCCEFFLKREEQERITCVSIHEENPISLNVNASITKGADKKYFNFHPSPLLIQIVEFSEISQKCPLDFNFISNFFGRF